MKKLKWVIIAANLLLLLGYMNYSITKKEGILESGQLVLLELAPVDPRSLMQGDYMTLRYDISANLVYDSMPKRGYCVVALDAAGVGNTLRFQENQTPKNEGELLIEYRAVNEWNISIGAESWFFQEGKGEKYEKAKYGGVKIDENGNSLLVGLYDERGVRIE